MSGVPVSSARTLVIVSVFPHNTGLFQATEQLHREALLPPLQASVWPNCKGQRRHSLNENTQATSLSPHPSAPHLYAHTHIAHIHTHMSVCFRGAEGSPGPYAKQSLTKNCSPVPRTCKQMRIASFICTLPSECLEELRGSGRPDQEQGFRTSLRGPGLRKARVGQSWRLRKSAYPVPTSPLSLLRQRLSVFLLNATLVSVQKRMLRRFEVAQINKTKSQHTAQ